MSHNVIECKKVWKVFGEQTNKTVEAVRDEGLGKVEVLGRSEKPSSELVPRRKEQAAAMIRDEQRRQTTPCRAKLLRIAIHEDDRVVLV